MDIYISRDIRKFKTKDIGNFSFKEAGYIALGLGLGFGTYRLTHSIECAIPIVMVVLVIGFFKPYGMTCIQFFRTVVKESMMPNIFINETDFEYNYSKFPELYGKDVKIPSQEKVIQTSTGKNKINKQDRDRILT